MDPTLKALCVEVLGGDVDSERFAWLLIETGVNLESYEFEVANSLLKQGDAIASISREIVKTLH
ncbi:MAG: hypothetical protein WC956_09920 [bacterium]